MLVYTCNMSRITFFLLLAVAAGRPVFAETIRVPQDHKTIQAAIDASQEGDLILVAAGEYRERIRLKPGITLRSDGDNTPGKEGLKRAEATIIDGGGKDETSPGIAMAEGSALDGFTVTNVGLYDDALWKKQFDSHGEDLGDEEGSVQAEGTVPAIGIRGVTCTVSRCIVHHNGDVGIGVLGNKNATTAPLINGNIVARNMGGGIGVAENAEAIIRGNNCNENLRAGIGCRQANPIVTDNVCRGNVRAGIGCREGAKPVVRGNKCFQNRRAGIGIRMEGTAPLVESNECFENEMAGIGCRDHASPVLRNNVCRNNKMAGIGCRDGGQPLIVGNECRGNDQAGIGVQGKSIVTIQQNQCIDNKLVAIGVTDGSTAEISKNELAREGGMPPIIAVKDGSTASIIENRISGGGVAAVLVQGTATLRGNAFKGKSGKQGNAVWVWADSKVTIDDNAFEGYRTAVDAKKATLVVTGNTINQFQATAIVIRESQKPAHVYGNTAISADAGAQVVVVEGASGIVEANVVRKE